MARRDLKTSAVALALSVDPQTIRYHARLGRIPFDLTPGNQRRFNLEEVKEALSEDRIERRAEDLDFSLDLETPTRGALTESAAMMISATSGYDEHLFDEEALPVRNFTDAFAVRGSARYALRPEAAGLGV